jgi:hypothetical protein
MQVGDTVYVYGAKRPLGSEAFGEVEAINGERIRIRWLDGSLSRKVPAKRCTRRGPVGSGTGVVAYLRRVLG